MILDVRLQNEKMVYKGKRKEKVIVFIWEVCELSLLIKFRRLLILLKKYVEIGTSASCLQFSQKKAFSF